jgi:uncharacterized protein (UPF0335 family)
MGKTMESVKRVAKSHGITKEKVLADVYAGIGHNSEEIAPTETTNECLKSFVARIERLEANKAEIAENIHDVYAELKGTGYNPKLVRKLIRERKMDEQKRYEEEEMLDLYRSALGMLTDTPLGQAAMKVA